MKWLRYHIHHCQLAQNCVESVHQCFVASNPFSKSYIEHFQNEGRVWNQRFDPAAMDWAKFNLDHMHKSTCMFGVRWVVAASLKSFQEVLRWAFGEERRITKSAGLIRQQWIEPSFTSTTYIKARTCMVLAGLRQCRLSPFRKSYVEHFENGERVKSAGLI